jgi:hypothetical protein
MGGRKMSDITDRELLAICNLCNLKLEFANLQKDGEETITTTANGKKSETKILLNHTICSMLEQERKSIYEDLGILKSSTKTRRIFYDLETEDDQDNPKTPLYTDVASLKKKAGIIYEYFEKYIDHGNDEGAFTKDWKIVYAADSYKLLKDFVKFSTQKNNSIEIGMQYKGKDGEYYLYKSNNVLYKESNGAVPTSGDDVKDYENDFKKIKAKFFEGETIKFPTRKKVKAMKDEDARIETVNIWTDVLGVILPGIGLAGSLVNSGIKASYFYLVFTYYAPLSITAVQQIPNIVDSGDKAEEVKEAINKNTKKFNDFFSIVSLFSNIKSA